MEFRIGSRKLQRKWNFKKGAHCGCSAGAIMKNVGISRAAVSIEALKRRGKALAAVCRSGVKNFLEDESGVGVIELVLILVVLIGLVAVFKTQINELLTKIFTSISSMSDDIL